MIRSNPELAKFVHHLWVGPVDLDPYGFFNNLPSSNRTRIESAAWAAMRETSALIAICSNILTLAYCRFGLYINSYEVKYPHSSIGCTAICRTTPWSTFSLNIRRLHLVVDQTSQLNWVADIFQMEGLEELFIYGCRRPIAYAFAIRDIELLLESPSFNAFVTVFEFALTRPSLCVE